MKLFLASFLSVVLGSANAVKFDLPAYLESDGVESSGAESFVRMGKSGKSMKRSSGGSSSSSSSSGVSAVYIMNNQPANGVQAYSRNVDTGLITSIGTFSTRGAGSLILPVNGLGSTDPLIVVGGCVLAVNAGSNELSSLAIDPSSGELEFVAKVPSNGIFPNSVAHHDGLVYVLNAAGQGHIQAFSLSNSCGLSAIGGPVELSQGGPVIPQDPAAQGFAFGSPSQIAFSPDGSKIVVTIKRNGGIAQEIPYGSINVYELSSQGTTSAAALTQTVLAQDNASIPFGFDFDSNGKLLIVDAAASGGAASGEVLVFGGSNFELELQDPVVTFEAASCWIEYNYRNRCAYVTNAGSATLGVTGDTISSLRAQNGIYKLVEQVAADNIPRPVDLKMSPDGRFLYVVSNFGRDNTGIPQLFVYEMGSDCGLTQVQATNQGFGEPDRTVPFAQNGLGGGTELGCAVYPAAE